MKMKKKKIWFAECLIALLVLICSLTVYAAEQKYQISIEYQYGTEAITGAEFGIFKVGDVSVKGHLSLTGDYKKFPVKLDVTQGSELQAAADTLYGYIQKEKLEPDHIVHTDETGHASVAELEKGVYLVVCAPYQKENYVYLTQPQLIVLPQGDSSLTKLEVKASGESVEERWIPLKVLKNWDDEGNSSARPKSVTIYLLRDGEVYDTVVLSKENNWRFMWENLYANALWTVVEEPVEGYLVIVEKTGNTFLVTNTSQKSPEEDPTEPTKPTDPTTPTKPVRPDDSDDPIWPNNPTKPTPDPKDPSNPYLETLTPEDSLGELEVLGEAEEDFTLQILPQTGMVWWPVILMVFGGLVCIISGIILCRREKHE